MEHLKLEALARMVDEPPEPAEAAHLRDCLVCRRELEAMRAQTTALASLADPEPRPGAWRALEAALAAEGLVRPQPARRFRPSHPLLRIAAGLLLFALGAGAGVTLWSPRSSLPLAQGPEESGATRGQPLGIMQPPAATVDTAVADVPAAAEAAPGARFVAARPRPAATPRRRAPALTPQARAAARELDEAEAAYVAALRRYAEIADPSSGADPETRLAALETLVETTGRALENAPGDPVLNGYHLAVLDERDALRRQIDRAQTSAWY